MIFGGQLRQCENNCGFIGEYSIHDELPRSKVSCYWQCATNWFKNEGKQNKTQNRN